MLTGDVGFCIVLPGRELGLEGFVAFLKRNKPLPTSKASRAQVLFSSTFPRRMTRKYHLPLRRSWQPPRDKKDGEGKGEEEDVSGGVRLEMGRTREGHPV